MPKITVCVEEKPYDIVIEQGLFTRISQHFKHSHEKRAVIVCDENTGRLFSTQLQEQLLQAQIESTVIELPVGEKTKDSYYLQQLYDFFFQAEISRSDMIIALGGGVIGDLTGYAAATFLRGVPLVQIPTTLLAQVDSSVGGKVAINVPQGKNLIGTFYQPSLVLADVDTLQFLDKRQFACGMAEVIKYACIADNAMLPLLEADLSSKELEHLVTVCCEIKRGFVEKDPFDKGERMKLNFGHTFAHALEVLMGYGEYLHGEAVAIGMVAAAKWGEILNFTPAGTSEKIEELCKKHNLPTQSPIRDPDILVQSMLGDKKVSGKKLNMIMLEELGKACIVPLGEEEILALAKEYLP